MTGSRGIRVALLVVAIGATGACGAPTAELSTGTSPDAEAPTTEASPTAASPDPYASAEPPEGTEHVETSASSAAVLTYDGRDYALSCGVVDPAKVAPQPAGSAPLDGRQIDLHTIAGVDPTILVAVPADGCALVADQQWASAFASDRAFSGTGLTPEYNAAWCTAALLPPDPAEGFDCADIPAAAEPTANPADASGPTATSTPPTAESADTTDAAHTARCAPLVEGYGSDAELVAAVAGPAPYASQCWIDGDVPKAPPPNADGSRNRPFDRVVLSVAEDGAVVTLRAGYRAWMPPPPPRGGS